MKKDVSVVRSPMSSRNTGNGIRYFFILIVMALVLMPVIIHAATPTVLDTSVSDLEVQVSSLQVTVDNLIQDQKSLLNRLALTNVEDCALLVAGFTTGTVGSSVVVPINLVPSTQGISGVQTDILANSNFSVSGVAMGTAASNANKQVSFSTSSVKTTAIVFGLNQTPIDQGTVANITFKTSPTMAAGFYPIMLENVSATDANGNSLPICSTSGEVEIQ